MDSFNFGNLKAKKANTMMMKQRQLRKIANFFRFVEVCVVLVLISKLSIHLPVAVKNSGDYFRDFSVFVVSPQFIFVIGNIIIVTLFAQSGQFLSNGSKSKTPEPDIYQKFIKNSTKNPKIKEEKQSIKTEDEEQSKYKEKQSIKTEDEEKQSMKTGDRKFLDYRRSETEKLRDFQRDKPRNLLRRSETETEKRRNYSYPQDGMSNDEFRRTVEAFIARQQRLRREEEYSEI